MPYISDYGTLLDDGHYPETIFVSGKTRALNNLDSRLVKTGGHEGWHVRYFKK